jgi:hypothetical protein
VSDEAIIREAQRRDYLRAWQKAPVEEWAERALPPAVRQLARYVLALEADVARLVAARDTAQQDADKYLGWHEQDCRVLGDCLAQAEAARDTAIQERDEARRMLWEEEQGQDRTGARLERVEQALRMLADAVTEERCNGCRHPRHEWGPVCGGMAQGDYTHFHSASWWAQAALAEVSERAALSDVTPEEIA